MLLLVREITTKPYQCVHMLRWLFVLKDRVSVGRLLAVFFTRSRIRLSFISSGRKGPYSENKG
jgi:hypothetical protein